MYILYISSVILVYCDSMFGLVSWIKAHPIVRTVLYEAGLAVASYLTANPSLFVGSSVAVLLVNTLDNEIAPATEQVSNVVLSNTAVATSVLQNVAKTNNVKVLPPLPAGFDASAAKANGFTVYENTNGNVIMSSPNVNWKGETITTWQNPDGSIIPSAPDLTGYTKL